jgi:S-adenosylmethionine synthetase
MELVIRTRESGAPGSQPVEIVERKGLGHPDTICDGIAEHVCVRLCRYYLDHVGLILHHNVDKILLCGGAARPAFGGGEVLEPMAIYLAGRATEEYAGRRIPVHDIAIEACRDWLRAHIDLLDVDRHVQIISRLRPGSSDLARIFARGGDRPLANDTSCGAGFAPLTDLEKTVLAVERALNSPETKHAHPEIGTDIKVMGVRHERRIHLTIGCAFVGRFISGIDDYARKKATAHALAISAAGAVTTLDIDAVINPADDLDHGEVYLTVTGTSAEAGDDGEVGRGNRVGGLITPYRVMTLEAAAGKNPVSHVGKLYQLVAGRIASSITTELHGVDDATCVIVSQIGRPVDDPQVADIGLGTAGAPLSSTLRAAVADITRTQLGRMNALREDLLAERLMLY